jgi:KAP-like P-loop domain-containing protein
MPNKKNKSMVSLTVTVVAFLMMYFGIPGSHIFFQVGRWLIGFSETLVQAGSLLLAPLAFAATWAILYETPSILPTSRLRAVCSRYGGLLLLVVMGAGTAVLAHTYCLVPIGQWATRLSPKPGWTAVLVLQLFVLLFAAWATIRRFRGLRIGQFHPRMVLYPPTWIAGVAAFGIYLLVMPLSANQATAGWDMLRFIARTSAILVIVSAVVNCGIAVVKFILNRRKRAEDSENQGAGAGAQKNLLADHTAFMNWVDKRETPIKKPNENLFDASRIARRLAGIALKTPGFSAVALMGAYGVGKSSVLNLVEYYIKNPDRRLADMAKTERTNEIQSAKAHPPFPAEDLVICRVSAWGADDDSVPRLILDAALKKLQRYVDCTALASVPFSYRQAMQASSSSTLGILASLLGADLNPRDVLKRMDRVVEAVGLRLLIIIEDVDRNDPDGKRPLAIASLLDGLHELEQISFIFALGRGHMAEPLVRLCEHIEPMPDLERGQVAERIDTFRRNLHNDVAYSQDVPIEQWDERTKRFGTVSPIGSFDNAAEEHTRNVSAKPIYSLAAILDTPRALKAALQHTSRAWESLHGEVSFDDLLCVQALRFGERKAFSFLANHIDPVRRHEGGDIPSKARRRERDTEWAKLADVVVNHAAAEHLLRFLTPDLLLHPNPEPGPDYQHIRVRTPVDYWTRVNSGAVDGVPDQALQHWMKDHDANVYDGKTLVDNMLKNPLFQSYSFQMLFTRYFGDDADAADQLASDILASVLSDLGVAAELYVKGVTTARHIMFRLTSVPKCATHKKWLQDEIGKALPVSLPFAMQLYESWRRRYPSVDADGATPDMRNDLLNVSRDIYGNDAQKLVRALDPKRPAGIRRLVCLHRHKQTDEDWAWLGPVIVDALSLQASIVGWELVTLLTENDDAAANITDRAASGSIATRTDEEYFAEHGEYPPPPPASFTFTEKRAEAIFGTQLTDVAKAFMDVNIDDTPTTEFPREDMEAGLRAAQEWAQGHLAMRKRQSADPPEDEGGENSDGAEG